MSEPSVVDSSDNLAEDIEEAMDHLLSSFDPRKNKLNLLLLAIPVALYANYTHQGGLAFRLLHDCNYAFGVPHG